MTKRLSFTKPGLRKAIEAARAAGLSVTGIKPDGTLLTCEAGSIADKVESPSIHADAAADGVDPKWTDVEA